jgi:hypothetical protein
VTDDLYSGPAWGPDDPAYNGDWEDPVWGDDCWTESALDYQRDPF